MGQGIQTALKQRKVTTILGEPVFVDNDGVVYEGPTGRHFQSCSAVICATGFRGNIWNFFEQQVRNLLGLEPQPHRDNFQRQVREMRAVWRTIPAPAEEEEPISLPMVYRGILPIGRFAERDLAIAGSTRRKRGLQLA